MTRTFGAEQGRTVAAGRSTSVVTPPSVRCFGTRLPLPQNVACRMAANPGATHAERPYAPLYKRDPSSHRCDMRHEHALQRALKGTGVAIDFSGTWVNELKSEMSLTQKGQLLTGTYASQKSAGGGQTIGDLQGYVDGDLISFIVLWRDYQAITSWTGQLDKSQTSLVTLWQMTSQVQAGDEWKSINAGADTFARK